MAEHVLEAISIRRKVTGAEEVQENLSSLIRKFATANLYREPAEVLRRLSREIFRQAQSEYLPYARAVGRLAAKPILDQLTGKDLSFKDMSLRGQRLARMQRYTQRNMLVLRAEFKREVGQLGGEIDALFAKGYRDGLTRKSIIEAAVQADKDELAQIAKVRTDLVKAEKRLGKAERRLATARNKKAARAEMNKAKSFLRAQKRRLRNVKTMTARFETRMHGVVRDGIRREAEQAQQEAFRQQGYETFAWVAVNGDDACPYCTDMHGSVKKASEWKGNGPGESAAQAEYCGSACMCILVPDEYKKTAAGLEEPLKKSWVK